MSAASRFVMDRRSASAEAVDDLHDRITSLQNITAALSETLSRRGVAERALFHAVSALDAETGAVWTCPPGAEEAVLLVEHGFPENVHGMFDRIPLTAESPVALALRTGESIWVESRAEYAKRFPVLEAAARARSGDVAFACVPLLVQRRAVGGLMLSFPNARSLRPADREFIIAIARQCAFAFERADLFETERRARSQAEASEAYYRLLADALPGLVATYRPGAGVEFWNRRCAEYTGFVPGMSWSDFIHPEDLPSLRARYAADRRGSEAWEAEYRIRRRDGVFRWHLVRAVPTCDERGQVARWFVTGVDIDDHVRVEQEQRRLAAANARLFESEKRAHGRAMRLQRVTSDLSRAATRYDIAQVVLDELHEFLAAARGAVYLRTPDGKALQAIYGRGLTPELEKAYGTVSLDGPTPMADCLRLGTSLVFRTLYELGAAYPRLAEVARAAGLVDYSLVVLPLVIRQSVEGVLLLDFEHDWTRSVEDLQFMEALAHQCAQALERSQLYEEAEAEVKHRDEFLSIAGHELRTPVTSLLLLLSGSLRSLDKGSLEPAELRRRLDRAGNSTKRLARLIDNLLDVSRLTSATVALNREKVDLAALCAEVSERLRESMEAAGCTYTPILESAEGNWDRTRLEQVVGNLLSNAIKYGAGAPIVLRVARHKGWARLDLRDGGIGIAPEDQQRVFERFERAVSGDHFGGLGVGLWVSRQLVEAHGGTITVTSAPGQGSTFTVELPLAVEPQFCPAAE